MKNLIFFILVAIFPLQSGFTQPYFQKSLDFNNQSDYGHFITNDGNNILILSLLDCVGGKTCTGVLKLDSLGNEVWRSVVALPNKNLTLLTLRPDQEKNYLLAGHTSFDLRFHSWIGEISGSNGDSLSSTILGDNINQRTEEIWEKEDGGYLLGIERFDDQLIFGHKALVALDNKKNVVWEKKLLLPGFPRDGFGNIQYLGDDRVLTSGHHLVYNEFGIATKRITKLNMFDTLGNMQWSITLPDTLRNLGHGARDYPVKARQTTDGNFAVVSVKDTTRFAWNNPSETNAAVYKIDSLGRLLWTYFFVSGDVKHTYEMKAARNGDIIGCGYSNYHLPDNDWIEVGWLYRISSEGKLLWERYFYTDIPGVSKQTRYGYLWDLTELEDGSIAATGMKIDPDGPTGTAINIWLLKTDSEGCITPGCSDRNVVFTSTQEAENTPAPKETFFKTYPNPATSMVYAEFLHPVSGFESRLRLLDFLGREITCQALEKGMSRTEINVDGLSKGIYLLNFETDGAVLQSEKIIIE